MFNFMYPSGIRNAAAGREDFQRSEFNLQYHKKNVRKLFSSEIQ